MKISNASINMESFHDYRQKEIINQSVQISAPRLIQPRVGLLSDRVSISEEARMKIYSQKHNKTSGTTEIYKADDVNSKKDKDTKSLLGAIARSSIGRDVSVKEIVRKRERPETAQNNQPQTNNLQLEIKTLRTFVRQEAELTRVTSAGIIKTEDNREIKFGLQLEMSRNSITLGSEIIDGNANATDPLVISFDGKAPELSDTMFKFDLNSDGTDEELASLKSGSGFLAIDINQDGKINNGSELFGPGTGNGYQELAAYDTDKNNWIDENDAVYNELKIWKKDEKGQSTLTGLKGADVGAIYLGSVDSDFSITNDQNQVQGMLRKTGLYVKESGEVQHMYQIDLTDQKAEVQKPADSQVEQPNSFQTPSNLIQEEKEKIDFSFVPESLIFSKPQESSTPQSDQWGINGDLGKEIEKEMKEAWDYFKNLFGIKDKEGK
ncbi:MAG: hypothetical protein HQK79_11955 [Desulfobacterales bacterium]|nr:hypothetical protein [Desulfobacterales bacterium]MBF0395598.1 hypothetical protein [Desulfobacterales bacterium]